MDAYNGARRALKGEYRRIKGGSGWEVAWIAFDCAEHPDGCVPHIVGNIKSHFPLANYQMGEVVPFSLL